MQLTLLDAEAGLSRVECSGDITVFDFAGGVNPLEALLGPAGLGGTILLDLAKSGYIDSSGVGWLLLCHRRVQAAGGRLIVHSIAPMVNHCFRVLRVYDVLNIAADEKAAREMAAARQAV